jgi:RNA polymerase sigma-70 factor (ECF subfamily)
VTDDDVSLLRAWRDGDRAAGEQLMRRYYDRVLRFFELKAEFVAEDLTQRTFLACVHAANTERLATSFKAYLFGVARRQYQEHQRRDGRKQSALRKFDFGEPQMRTSVSRLLARKQEQQLLLQALVCLPEDMASAVQLYYWEGMRAVEIAAVLDIPASTVTTRLDRARQLLRERIEELGRKPEVKAALLDDLAGWTRSLVEPDAGR